ncbi:MAG: segregation/condensation protein A [Planctomycetes bacterium]|nr:segregation/condensation protein A [Planctomycetota bacterium]
MEPYRVNLDVYNGPLDLLLYLIRRDEVDIYDIPIAAITEQYCKYVDFLQEINPNLAGEFLVMAATLLEIKSRMLLPTPTVEEGDEGEGPIDPRADLVRQLLQYKAFKDAAAELADAADLAATRHPRRPVAPEFEQAELDLESIQIWTLLEAFASLMASVGVRERRHEVIYDDTPISLHAEDVVDRLTREGNMTFREIFGGRPSRSEIVGLFLALLELIRQDRVRIQQEKVFGEIYVFLHNPESVSKESPVPAGDPVVEAGAAMEGLQAAAGEGQGESQPRE